MKAKNQSLLLGYIFLVGLFLPHTSNLLMLVNPILCLFLYFTCRDKGCPSNIRAAKSFVIFIISVSLIVMLVSGSIVGESSKSMMKGLNLVLLFLCFPFVGSSNRIYNGFFYFSIIYILSSQLVYLFNISFLQNFFEEMYPVRGEKTTHYFRYMQNNISFRNLFDWRLSGIYHNPNQAARYVTLISVLFFINNRNKPINKIIWFLSFSLFSILLTGSRTGLFIELLLVFSIIYKRPTFKLYQRLFIYFGGIVFFIIMWISSTDFSGIRGFQVEEGLSNSAIIKWYTLVDYLSQPNSVYHILFGHGDSSLWNPSNIDSLDKLDSEYGEIIFSYGFLGLVSILFFYFLCFKYIKGYKRIIFILLLWIISSTILVSYRMSFLFLLSLSYLLSNNDNNVDTNSTQLYY